jgi:hypothetical protein
MADELEVQNTPEPTPIEQRAMEQGWKPQDQWEGNPEDWRPAKEFVDRGELFKKIDELKRENKAIKQGHEELMKHHRDVRKIAYEQALADLKAQKAVALANGEAELVVELDDKIDETKERHRQAQAQPQVEVETGPDPVFEAWTNRNNWYVSDEDMKVVADNAAKNAYLRGERDKQALLTVAESAVKKAFPHKFTNPNREKPGAVDGGSNKKAQSKVDASLEMSEAEKHIMNKILRVTPSLTKEKYLEEYKARKSRGE